MERRYSHDDLRRAVTEIGFRPVGWSASEVADFRLLDQCARAALTPTDLQNMRMLRIGPHPSDDPSRVCATLTSGRPFDLTFATIGGYLTVTFDHSTEQGDELT